MGGSVGKALNPTNILRGTAAAASFGTSEAFQKKPFGLINNPTGLGLLDGASLAGGTHDPYISGPFSLDPNQVAGDQTAINNLGEKQYQETLGQIPTEVANALNKSLPMIAEDYNAGHLLNSSGYGNEVARQQSQISKDLVSQAMAGRQGYQTGALQRGLSLEDFVNQANVAKSIGAQMAPQMPNGKQNFSTTAQGIGALAPLAKMAIK